MDQTLDQQRAAFSLDVVERVKRQIESEEKGDEYAGYVVKLAGDILINGLGQSLAQLQAAAKDKKKEDPHYWLYEHVQEWLCKRHPYSLYAGEEDLLHAITKHDQRRYRWALVETLAWLEWHRKIAVAELKKAEGDD
ncbi:CRISPR-associated Cmr5 family protein [Laceyella sediminis]|uniref:CRISPR type III-B/RAMP module-associated protein Cmr5 n=1 Tax=Laceyella sediminis TaxID=573074 RepID=A0ABX5EP21_9BACL|nr:type III-B CRISPR module-associated protein Cmr5 [Laceyella sediminis]PRZ14434.1 CRISPR-associated Cmr5 family protein [Laceyella sediminis]